MQSAAGWRSLLLDVGVGCSAMPGSERQEYMVCLSGFDGQREVGQESTHWLEVRIYIEGRLEITIQFLDNLSNFLSSPSESKTSCSKIGSTAGPMEYSRVLTWRTSSSESSFEIDRKRRKRCFQAGHDEDVEKSNWSGGANLAIV